LRLEGEDVKIRRKRILMGPVGLRHYTDLRKKEEAFPDLESHMNVIYFYFEFYYRNMQGG
jgi:hypothetical protein